MKTPIRLRQTPTEQLVRFEISPPFEVGFFFGDQRGADIKARQLAKLAMA